MATEVRPTPAPGSRRASFSNSIEFMRQVIKSGLGIGFFTPVGFLEEIRPRRAGGTCRWPSRGLAQKPHRHPGAALSPPSSPAGPA